ncbi:RadC family protein [Bacillus rubiinfantis]|uniref:RadC family protein n=1 Tax=Bacillus rubiinfantis TaxID=1499680 RepID=UPI000693BE1C|nr:DNA repair protein RadC [Bacillus rubiinfantis]
MENRKYIEVARESVSMYPKMGSDLSAVELQELLAVLLGRQATPELSGRLASKGIRTLIEMSVQELKSEGLTELKALELHAAFLLSKKFRSTGKAASRYTIRSPEDAASYLMDEMKDLTQEHFVALMLNTKNEVIAKKTIFIGSLNASIVHPREIYKEAFRHSAASIIVSHNHPSGHPSPSTEDVEVTKRLVEAGKLMGVDCLDHIIIGDHRFISLKEKGYM